MKRPGRWRLFSLWPARLPGNPKSDPKALERSFSLNLNGTSHRLEVQAFLILERVFGSKEFRVSVLLHADGQFIGKTSLELSLRARKFCFPCVGTSRGSVSSPVRKQREACQCYRSSPLHYPTPLATLFLWDSRQRRILCRTRQ